MQTRLEFREGKSDKFWEIRTGGRTHTVRYGRSGTEGREVTKSFATPAAAEADAQKLVAQKLKKGYRAVSGAAVPATKTAAEKPVPKKTASSKAAPKKKTASSKKEQAGPFEAFAAICLEQPDAYEAEWHAGKRIKGRRSFRIKHGEHREFAFWVEGGDQPGAHVRFADPSRLDDGRFERSRAMRGAKHNWMYVKPGLGQAALKELVAESHRTSQERGGGKAVVRELYEPLRRAVAAAGAAGDGLELHAGGPAAKIVGQEGPSSFRLALWSTEQVKHLVPANEKKALAAGLEALRGALRLYDDVVARYEPRQVRMGPGYETLSKAADRLKDPVGDSPPLVVARAAAGAFHCIPGGYSQRAVAYAAEAAEAASKALVEAGDRDAVRRYLVELDGRILAEELAAVAASRKLEVPAGARVLWRGADEKGFPALWLVRLDGEAGHGLLGKLGRRWSFTAGRRDDVLASVPDALFEAAALALRD